MKKQLTAAFVATIAAIVALALIPLSQAVATGVVIAAAAVSMGSLLFI